MKFIVKFFPEITIKSKPVRKQFVRHLTDNVRSLLRQIDAEVKVQRDWDKLVVESQQEEKLQRFVETLSHTPGIAYFNEVSHYPLGDLHDIFEKTKLLWGERLAGKTFAVRCKRAGTHAFSSGEIERYVGGGLNQHTEAKGVQLKNPDITVMLEVRDENLYITNCRYEGLGGFPMGSLDPVISLISGGFDSNVASYLMMKRGLRTHFLFFNLGGHAHEIGVKEVALYLWQKYGASHRVRFISVPFDGVVGEILKKVDNSQMGVILKRMMLRAATTIADDMGVQAVVTGECIAQVSSQTLTNLSVIDSVTNKLVLRPLITMDKPDIVKLSAEIGTEEFAASMPEYCGVISVKPTTKAKPEKIESQESRFDFAVLEQAIADTRLINIDEIDLDEQIAEVEVMPFPVGESIVIDVRHPTERELQPLKLGQNEVLEIPFYELHSQYEQLDQAQHYMLYCERGTMSRLHASHLKHEGYHNVSVYRPQ
ncbi:thiamine biosynthesis protein ThiI [Sinobacterium caligoides]|uniref:tRNA sulfurtransferase n=1 Tax=Sinobacterium caligoides TaxID=933926 RepID=A0A3N2DGE2_9GAMM|nr:tRNA uracil 4-sulfurtransferase ThiI [Sinobacterium caligoides]ROR98866.1 thiamine biosynthesis protein ThiI [Sinobacterium caligoides]